MNCLPLQLPEQLCPLNKHQLCSFFIPPASDLHLITYFAAQGAFMQNSCFYWHMCIYVIRFWIFWVVSAFTLTGQKAISHQEHVI